MAWYHRLRNLKPEPIGAGIGSGAALSLCVLLILDRLALSLSGAGDIALPRIHPATLLLVAAVMAAVGALAACLPSRRAAKVDPLVSLRHS